MVVCRSVTLEDVNALPHRLGENGIEFLGLRCVNIYKAVISDAIVQRNVSIIIANDGVELIGWTIAVIDSRNYWMRFLLRHPFLAARAVTKRILGSKRLLEGPPPSKPHKLPQSSKERWQMTIDRRWGVSSPLIARHLNITVLERFRQGGVATMLQDTQIEELRGRGANQIDAYIHTSNEPSIAFHKKKGWALVKEEMGMLQITLDM